MEQNIYIVFISYNREDKVRVTDGRNKVHRMN